MTLRLEMRAGAGIIGSSDRSRNRGSLHACDGDQQAG